MTKRRSNRVWGSLGIYEWPVCMEINGKSCDGGGDVASVITHSKEERSKEMLSSGVGNRIDPFKGFDRASAQVDHGKAYGLCIRAFDSLLCCSDQMSSNLSRSSGTTRRMNATDLAFKITTGSAPLQILCWCQRN